MMSKEPTLADAPAGLGLKDKVAWLQQAKNSWRQQQSGIAVAAPTHETVVKEAEVPVPEVAAAVPVIETAVVKEESAASKALAIMKARKEQQAAGVAPAMKANVLPQISLLEAAAAKVQAKNATGSYGFPDAGAVKALELDPNQIEDMLMRWDLAIETQNPEAKTLLQEINSLLRSYEELAHLMSEEQIGVVVNGALAMAGTEVATLNANKGKNSTKATNAKMDASDF